MKVISILTARMDAVLMKTPFLTTLNPNLDLDTLFGGIVDLLIKIAFYVGAIMAIGGVFSLFLAYKDENADAQSKAIRVIVIGGSLISLRVFLQMAGIIQ